MKKQKKFTQHFQMMVSEEMNEKLARLAEEKDRSMANLVRLLVKRELKDNGYNIDY